MNEGRSYLDSKRSAENDGLDLGRGLFLAFMNAGYLWSAVIDPWGEPDQSRLFWYALLPIFGLLLIRIGIRLRRRHRDAPPR